jgi:FixJ family two-component response regulator
MMVHTNDRTLRAHGEQPAAPPTLIILEQGELSASSLPSNLSIPVLNVPDWRQAEQISREFACCVLVDFDFNPARLGLRLPTRRNDWLQLSCVACSDDTSVRNIVKAMRAGYVDFVAKPIQAEPLLAACSYACRIDSTGEHCPSRFRARLATLSKREFEVLKLFLDGLNTKMIAKQLGVSYQTIDKHRNRALKKLRIGSLIDLAKVIKGASLNAG